jgi:hypothetical protein
VVARAHIIIARLQRDRLVRGRESDSDLSLLDSKQFEGIDIDIEVDNKVERELYR